MNLKQDLIRHYQWLRQYGYNDSHSGNASIRIDDTVWVTPTGACADTLEADQLIACSVDGTIGDGASLDARLHVMVYQKNPQATVMLHSHGPYSVALTMHGEDFVPVDFEGHYYFKKVPVIDLPYDAYIEKSASAISDVLQHSPVTVYRGHGVYVAAETLNLAYKWTCSFELSAKTAFIAQQAGTLK